MTSQFTSEGKYIPVTVVQVGPCVVTQVKTADTDGYNALQLGFGKKTPKNVTKPMKGHLSKSGSENFEVLREVPVDDPESYKPGQTVNADVFGIGEKVEVVGITKGRGFSGVMKRHGFSGGKKTHGSHSHRIPGSIGCSAWPAKVIKGKKMPGNYGNDQLTLRNVEVFDIRAEDNLVLLKGPVPGSKSGHITIRKPKFTK